MPITLAESNGGTVLEVRASGTLGHAEYVKFEDKFNALRQRHGTVSVLWEMRDFHGWDAKGLWDDAKFDLKHFADVERFAMVGEQEWEKYLTTLVKPFTAAKVKYFDVSQLEAARRWAAGGSKGVRE